MAAVTTWPPSEDLLIDTNKHVRAKVQVGTGVLVNVVGNRSLKIYTLKGKRYIKEVMLVPGLAENMWSVCQMTEHGYFLLFGDYGVDVYDDRTLSNLVVRVKQKGNKCFPLMFNSGNQLAMSVNMQQDAIVWHKMFSHLNYRSLK